MTIGTIIPTATEVILIPTAMVTLIPTAMVIPIPTTTMIGVHIHQPNIHIHIPGTTIATATATAIATATTTAIATAIIHIRTLIPMATGMIIRLMIIIECMDQIQLTPRLVEMEEHSVIITMCNLSVKTNLI